MAGDLEVGFPRNGGVESLDVAALEGHDGAAGVADQVMVVLAAAVSQDVAVTAVGGVQPVG